MTATVRSALYLLVGLGFVITSASAVTDFRQNEDGDYQGELDPNQGYDVISLPIDGAVRASDIRGCEFEGEPKAYRYNGFGYDSEYIHGRRGNALNLENSCEFTINQDDVINTEPRDIDNNEWFVFSPTEQRMPENLYAANGCAVNGYDGHPVYQVDTSGTRPVESGVLEGEKSYWLRLQGQNCEVDFLESAADISVQIDRSPEQPEVDDQVEVTVSAESESEGMSRIELNQEKDIAGELEPENEGNPCIKIRKVYSCEKTFKYTPKTTGRRVLTASVYNLASEEEQERVVLEVDAQDEESVDPGDDTEDDSSANGGDTESGGEGDSATGTGKLQFELVDTEDRQMSGGSINVESVSHSYPKEFGDPYEVIYGVPKGQELDVSIECGNAQLNAEIKLESDTRKIELLLAEPNPSTLCSQYGGVFSERSEDGIFDVREGDPRPEPVTLGSAEYKFSVDNGNQRIPFKKVPDEVSEFEQDRAYKLLFSVRAYRPGTSSTVDVFDEDVEMSVQVPDGVVTNGDCGKGAEHRCNAPASAELFDSGNYTVQLFDTQKQQTIKRKEVELPEISYSGYY